MKRKLINRGGMIMVEGRINVHLGELKERLQQLHGWGDLSRIVRVLIESYLEGRIMHLSPEISKLIDEGKDEEAIVLLTSDLVALRQRRVQAGQRASNKRSSSKTQKAKDQAGIKSAKRQDAEAKVEEMLNQTGEEVKDDVEKPREEAKWGVSTGVARAAVRRKK
jgi:hypothetical protein